MATPRKKPEDILKSGRKTKYSPAMDKLAYRYALMGASDEELASFLEIAVNTLYNWKKIHPTFLQALNEGKASADAFVSQSLYHRARGFTKKVEEARVVSKGEGAGSEIEIVEVKKYFPPDVEAAKFWLKNRQPKTWRDKKEIDLGEGTIQIGYGKEE